MYQCFPTQNLNIVSLVDTQTENVPRPHWILDPIIEIYHGMYGGVRTVTVKTSNNELLRPAPKTLFIRENKEIRRCSVIKILFETFLTRKGGCQDRSIYVRLIVFKCVSCTLVSVVVIHT